jgi:Domain of unknown function (DUF4266)
MRSRSLAVGLRRLAWAAPLALQLLLTGCATTRVYQREHLTDRIMTFEGDAKESARRAKSLDAREGSTGGTGGAGGGCACN